MIILDYVILAVLLISTVIGVVKGFIKQLLTIVGVVVVATLTATLVPYVQSWLANPIPDESTRTVVAMIASVLIIAVVYGLLAWIVTRLLKNITIVKVLDRILGGVVGFAVVYFVFAVIVALFNSTSESFLPLLKGWLGESFQTSWVVTHIYKNNFFGDWVIRDIAEKLLNNIQPTA